MEKERLAEYLERYHLGANSAATSRELELTFGIKGIEVRHLVNRLRRDGVPIASSGSGYFYAATEQGYGAGGTGHHRPPDPADRRHRRRHPRPEPLPGAGRHGADPPSAGRG